MRGIFDRRGNQDLQVRFPVFSIDPSYLESVGPFIRKAVTERKEVLLALDFDDTIIKLDETIARKTPVINESLIRFLVELFERHPAAQFKIIILSARRPDLEIVGKAHPCILIRSALPVFLSLLNTALEEKSLSDKKVTSIDDQYIYCIQGKYGFVKRTYSYFRENVLESFSAYYWRHSFRRASDVELHRILIAGRFSDDVRYTHEEEFCLEKGPFLANLLREIGASYCLHVDDNLSQIESVYTHVREYVMPVMVCCRPHPSPVSAIVAPAANASSQVSKRILPGEVVEVIERNVSDSDCDTEWSYYNSLSV